MLNNGEWEKHKYVKKIPKPGGGYYYVYPEQLAAQAKNKLKGAANKVNNAVNNLKDKSGYTAKQQYNNAVSNVKSNLRNTKPTFGSATLNSAKSRAQNVAGKKTAYESSHLGKTNKTINKANKSLDKALDKTKESIKKAGKKVGDAIGLDERAAYKESQKGLKPLTKQYRKNRYDETLAGKVERGLKPVSDAIGKAKAKRKAISDSKKESTRNTGSSTYVDMDDKKTYYVANGTLGKTNEVTETKSKLRRNDAVRSSKMLDIGVDTGVSIGRGVKKVAKKASEINEGLENAQKTLRNKTLRALALDDNVERAKKNINKAKAKKKIEKGKKKVSKTLKKLKK